MKRDKHFIKRLLVVLAIRCGWCFLRLALLFIPKSEIALIKHDLSGVEFVGPGEVGLIYSKDLKQMSLYPFALPFAPPSRN